MKQPGASEDALAFDNSLEGEAAAEAAVGHESEQYPKWSKLYITLFVLGSAAVMLAQLAPSSFSLAIRIQQLQPEAKDALLSVALTVPAVAIIFVNPVVGILSDTTRSRWGKRRPWMVGGLIVGIVGLLMIAFAPNVPLVILGWTVGYLGLTTTSAMFGTYMGDRLPESQRGLVAGINGAMVQISPILGILLSGRLVDYPVLLFAVPGIVAVLGALPFVIRMKDPSTIGEDFPKPSILGVFKQVLFDPRKYPDFGWVWISKLLVFVSIYSMSVYSVYFLMERLSMDAGDVAGITAMAGGLGILAAMIGALGGGIVSDKIKRRKPLILLAGVLFCVGLVTVGLMQSVAMYLIGSVLFTLGSGLFGSVDQALTLDVLPSRKASGRFIAIMALGNEIPKAIAPAFAGLLVAFGGGYQTVYFVAAAFAVVGCLLVLGVKKVR